MFTLFTPNMASFLLEWLDATLMNSDEYGLLTDLTVYVPTHPIIGCISVYPIINPSINPTVFNIDFTMSHGAQKVPNRKDQKQTLRDPDGSLAVKMQRGGFKPLHVG